MKIEEDVEYSIRDIKFELESIGSSPLANESLLDDLSILDYEATSNDESTNFDTFNLGNPNNVWVIDFDGSFSSTILGARVFFISPKGKKIPFSFKLQFDNTNNTTKYESFLLGIKVACKKGIKILHAQGDAELLFC